MYHGEGWFALGLVVLWLPLCGGSKQQPWPASRGTDCSPHDLNEISSQVINIASGDSRNSRPQNPNNCPDINASTSWWNRFWTSTSVVCLHRLQYWCAGNFRRIILTAFSCIGQVPPAHSSCLTSDLHPLIAVFWADFLLSTQQEQQH